MRPEEIEKFLESDDPEVNGKIYSAASTSYDKLAFNTMIQAISIRQMQKLDKSATKLTKVGIWVAFVGVALAAVQIALAFI